jgi:hypothetical protein
MSKRLEKFVINGTGFAQNANHECPNSTDRGLGRNANIGINRALSFLGGFVGRPDRQHRTLGPSARNSAAQEMLLKIQLE